MRTALLACFLLIGCAGSCARTEPRPIHVMAPDEGETFWYFHDVPDELGSGLELTYYIDPETHPEAGASFAHFKLGPGGALPVHRHDKTEEIAYIVSGRGMAVALDESGNEMEIPLGPGFVWYNPPGVWHAVRNPSDRPLVLVFATIPNEKKGLMTFFREIGVKPGEPAVVLPEDEFECLAREHDLILRGEE